MRVSPSFLMEWLEGRTLRDHLAERALSIDQILVSLAIEMADALAPRTGLEFPGSIAISSRRTSS